MLEGSLTPWRLRGTVGRDSYAVVGILGFAVKHNLDRLLALAFGQPWGIFNYWSSPFGDLAWLTAADRRFGTALLLQALPFMWIGLAMTLRRLRSAGLPTWLVVLFFVPFVNLVFFFVLCLLPPRPEEQAPIQHRGGWLDRMVPVHSLGSAAMGILVANLIAVPLVVIAVRTLNTYGWGVFVGLPFSVGLISVLFAARHEQRTVPACLAISALAVTTSGLLLLATAVEGLICILMAAPIGLALALGGGLIGFAITAPRGRFQPATALFPALLLALPLGFVVERATLPSPALYEVTSSIEIDAPPAAVWRHVVSFAELPPPDEWIFRAGIAYPIRAEIDGAGVGAQRRCVFSTGAFIEPIEVWDEPRLLKFSVESNPPPMQEWTPYREIHPPHLKGFLESEGGQFLLVPLPDGRTRLEGTTWYHHGLWPSGYWKLWSDAIVHRIHLRVLRHIEREAEAETAVAAG